MNDVIKTVTLKLGSKEIELTLDEARKLKAALNELFAEPQVIVKKEFIPTPTVVIRKREMHVPYYPNVQPWRQPNPFWYKSDFQTVCGTVPAQYTAESRNLSLAVSN